MPGISIDFTVSGADATARANEKVADSADRAAKAHEKQAKAAKGVQGPYQRLDQYQQDFARAVRGGDLNAARDADLAIKRAQGQIHRAEHSPNFQQRFMDVLKTSRFGKGGIMPLVGKTASLLGPEGTESAIIGTAAVEAAKALYDMTEKAADAGRAFQSLAFAGGGSGADTARLAGLAGALGLSPAAMGSLAEGFNQRITSDPMGMAFGAQLGVVNAPGAFGSQNWSRELLTAIESLRKIADPQARLLAARQTGLEAALPLTTLSNKTWDALKGDANTNQSVFSPEFQQKSEEFQTAIARMGSNLETTGAALSGPLMDDITNFATSVADATDRVNKFLTLHAGDIKTAWEWTKKALNPFSIGEGKDALSSGDGVEDQHFKATRDLTDATKENTQQMRAMQQGAFGTGPRFRSVTGDIQDGEMLRRGLESGGFQLGYFT